MRVKGAGGRGECAPGVGLGALRLNGLTVLPPPPTHSVAHTRVCWRFKNKGLCVREGTCVRAIDRYLCMPRDYHERFARGRRLAIDSLDAHRSVCTGVCEYMICGYI